MDFVKCIHWFYVDSLLNKSPNKFLAPLQLYPTHPGHGQSLWLISSISISRKWASRAWLLNSFSQLYFTSHLLGPVSIDHMLKPQTLGAGPGVTLQGLPPLVLSMWTLSILAVVYNLQIPQTKYFSFECVLLCVLSRGAVLQAKLHCSQLKRFSCVCLCFFMRGTVLHANLQCSQLKGFPSCVCICFFRLPVQADVYVHILQLNGCSPEWTRMWFFRFLVDE